MKNLLKSVLARTPYRVVRRDRANRFTAIEEALASMKLRGFTPRSIIEGGVNVGEFSSFAMRLFPNALAYAIEPQPGCKPALERLTTQSPGTFKSYPVALCGPEQEGGTLTLSTDESATSTGACVVEGDLPNGRTVTVQCLTLDGLLAEALRQGYRTLLNLDLQGYELPALRAGHRWS